MIPNDQLRRNGVRSSDLIPNDQLRRNGVRSSDLIVCVSPVRNPCPVLFESRSRRTPIGGRAKRVRRSRTESPRRPSEARPPASDRKDFTNRTALIVRYCFDPATTSDVVHGSEVLKLDCECKSVPSIRKKCPSGKKCPSERRSLAYCST